MAMIIAKNEHIGVNNNVNVYLHYLVESSITYLNAFGVKLPIASSYIQLNQDCNNMFQFMSGNGYNITNFLYPYTVVNAIRYAVNMFSNSGLSGFVPIPVNVVNIDHFCFNAKNIIGLIGDANSGVSISNMIGAVIDNPPHLTGMTSAFDSCTNYYGPSFSGPNVINMRRAFAETKTTGGPRVGDNVTDMSEAYRNVWFNNGLGTRRLVAACGNSVINAMNAYNNTNGLMYITSSYSVEYGSDMYSNLKTDNGVLLNLESLNNCNLTEANNMFKDAGIKHSIIINTPKLKNARSMFSEAVSTSHISDLGRTLWVNAPNLINAQSMCSTTAFNITKEVCVVLQKVNLSESKWAWNNSSAAWYGILGGYPSNVQANRTLVVANQDLYNYIIKAPGNICSSSFSIGGTEYNTNYQFSINLRDDEGSIYNTLYLNSTRRYVGQAQGVIPPVRIMYCPDLENDSFVRDLNINCKKITGNAFYT